MTPGAGPSGRGRPLGRWGWVPALAIVICAIAGWQVYATRSGEAVLICGEQITINEREARTDAELVADLAELLRQRKGCYAR